MFSHIPYLQNNHQISTLPFLGKMTNRMVAELHVFLDIPSTLDPFPSGFRPGYGMELVWVILLGDIHLNADKSYASLLNLLDKYKMGTI